jgi:uncharacterized protein DUF5655
LATITDHSLESHFVGRDPRVRSTYAALLDVAQSLGPVREEAKKTSIHLVRSTAFAGIGTRRSWLVLTLKAAADIKSPRISKHERASSNRWHLEVRLDSPEQVDREVKRWMKAAYELSC